MHRSSSSFSYPVLGRRGAATGPSPADGATIVRAYQVEASFLLIVPDFGFTFALNERVSYSSGVSCL